MTIRSALAVMALLAACEQRNPHARGVATPSPAVVVPPERTPAQAQAQARPPASSGAASAAWKDLIPAGATVEEQVTADLDADGVAEVVVLASEEDRDLAEMEGATREQVRMNLTLTVHVFARRGGGYVELDRVSMLGGPQPLEVAALKGGGSGKLVVATALHCGASCAGIEAHVLGVRDGRVERLMDRDSVDHGHVGITSAGELEVREAVYSGEDRADPAATQVTQYVVRDGALAVAARRLERP